VEILLAKFIALGSNLEPRKEYLESAVERISSFCEIKKVSPIYETPALLPENAPSEWDSPFLNAVIEVSTEMSSGDFLNKAQEVEKDLGRKSAQNWAPRTIDIDILFWDLEEIKKENLVIPHPQIFGRSFVLDPLKDLDPGFAKTARDHTGHSPLIMGIVNLTPDSFSDGGRFTDLEKFSETMSQFSEINIPIVDLGSQSTRPGASRLSSEEEWKRLKPYLAELKELNQTQYFSPKVSIDSFHPQVIARSLEYGIDIINDVSGLLTPDMLNILKNTDASYVLMHSLSVPADPKQVLSDSPVEELKSWLEDKLETLIKNGIDLSRVIFDPGIGFGKTASQSLEIIKRVKEFHEYPLRLMVGHSRKSFMKNFGSETPSNRDVETLAISIKLMEQGVDILRVHNPQWHMRAMRAWNHVTN